MHISIFLSFCYFAAIVVTGQKVAKSVKHVSQSFDLSLKDRSDSSSGSSSYSVIKFENLGFSGTYQLVKELSDVTSDKCTCELSDDTTSFSGSNAPFNEEVSVHFRGPLVLSLFGYFTSENFLVGDNSSGSWERRAYYGASSSTSENVTFLTKAGTDSPCLGKALTYAGSNGTSEAKESTVLSQDAQISSNEEYVIFSNISCDSSGFDNDCGVYRSGIPAYHGYYGKIKMFLFEFKMPTESEKDEDTSNYNMPAIWLLNAHIPRTSQYALNVNCSCWRSGCGEFDIFEIMNTTEANDLYSTVHDYQGTGDIENGLQADGHLTRDTEGTMKGGVVFDKDGNAIVFMSNSSTFDSNISASKLNSWIEEAGYSVVDKLDSVTATSTSKSSKGEAIHFYKTTAIQKLFAYLSILVTLFV
ncbi:uncharacterized protein PRCAT00001475001 [Priceomyces carsonii]|uniref:uncharacterized protein n=1 Tax=Priceomyces carsonii TaxID=28549 RepID=UPI002ED77D01|nr:unnamed protein product [Priceomyces carsonii]